MLSKFLILPHKTPTLPRKGQKHDKHWQCLTGRSRKERCFLTAVLLIPLGFGVWQLAAAAITGFIAKENVVGTIASVYGISNFINTEELTVVAGANEEVAMVLGLTKAAALACLMFNLFTPPCFAAIGAMNSEIKDKKWLLGGIGLQIGTGYTIAFFVYQIGSLIETGRLGDGFIYGLLAVLLMVVFVAGLIIKAERVGNK